MLCVVFLFCFFKQKTAYEMRISDWSSDVCSSDLSGSPAIATSIIAVDPVVDPVTRLASVFARISASAEIAPGEPLKGEITISSNNSALRIPQIALLDAGGQKFVYTVLPGTAKRVDVPIGSTDGGLVEVLPGIQHGDGVVPHSTEELRSGRGCFKSVK